MSYLVLANFNSNFPVDPACPVYTAYCQAVKAKQFLAQMTNLSIMKANSCGILQYPSFFYVINLYYQEQMCLIVMKKTYVNKIC